MKPKLPVYFSFPGYLLLAGTPFIIASGFASAAAYTWDGGGGDSNWQTSGNWNPDSAPLSGTDSDLIFAGTTRLTPSNDFAALSDFGSLSFASGAGAFTLGGNSITLNGNITNSSSNLQTIAFATTLASGAHTVTTNSNSVTISGAVSGGGSLTKSGAGTLTLSGANIYSGATSVNGGTLGLSGVGGTLDNSAVTVNSTGIFSVTNTSATGSAVTRTNGLTLNGGKLKVTGSSAQNTTDTFGVLTLGQGAGIWEGGAASASVLSGGNNVILVSPNSLKNTRLNFTSATVNAGGTVLFSNNGGSVIGANTLASAAANGINVAFTTTAPTLIGDAVSGGTITTTSGIIPWAVTNASGGTTLSDFVTYDSAYGVRSLAATAGTYASNLALSGGKAQNVKMTGGADSTNNTNATVNSLILNNQSADITQNIIGTLTVNSGALLLAPGFTGSALSTTIAGGTLQLGTGGADGFIFMQQGRLNTISSVISGPDASHHLTIDFGNANNSGGVLVLSGNNSYAGGTIVNSSNANSALVIGGTSTLGLSLTAGTTGSLGGGDLTLNNIKVLLNRSNAVTLANNISGTGASVIQQSATGTATLSGNISGTVGVTQSTASSTLVLSGTNTNTGTTTLSAGTLQFNGAASMSGGSALALTTGTTLNLRSDTTASFPTAGISAPATGTYNIDVGNLTSGTGQTLTLAGAMDFANGNQSLNITSGSSGYTLGLGAITHSTTANGSSFTINAATAPTTISSFKFGSYGSNLTLPSGNVSIGGLIFNSNGSETITVAGANATFTGSNTATGSRAAGAYAVILNSGTLNMNYAGFMSNVNSGGSSLTLAGGTLDNTSGGTVTESWNPTVALNGNFAFGGTNDLNLGTGAVTLNASRQITTNGSALLTLGGGIGGAGFTLTKAGAGNLRLNGVIGTGSGGVTVTGGILTLAGNNIYSGATTVSAGKLVVTGSIANSAVTVNNAGTILASDTAATIGSSLLINNGAILAPGDAGAAGTATVSGATTFNNGSIFSWDISSNGTNYDKLQTASLAGEVTPGDAVFRIVVADSGFSDGFWNSGTKTWNNIFTTNGTTAISDWTNLFSLSVVNSSFNPITPVNGSFTLSGSTLTWSAVPEPTSAFAGLLIGAGLLRRRRKN